MPVEIQLGLFGQIVHPEITLGNVDDHVHREPPPPDQCECGAYKGPNDRTCRSCRD